MAEPTLPPDEQPLAPASNLLPESFFLPPTAPDIDDEDNFISLSMGDYTYEGYLKSNWSRRITRLNQLLITLVRFSYRLMGNLNFNIDYTMKFPNPYNNEESEPDKVIKEEGVYAIFEMLKGIDKKVTNLHEDLPKIEAVASVVEHWQLKKEANRPQCIFLFGEWEQGDTKIGAPKWQTAVPYYDFNLAPSFNNSFGYWKGERQGILTLSDNSKVIIYARDDQELTRMFNRLLVGIRADMKEDHYIKKGSYHGPPFHVRYVRLRRIDYYSTGQLRGPMDDYRWFPASTSPPP